MKWDRDNVQSLALAIAGPMLGGQISGLVCAKDVTGKWYKKLLKRPKWNPPNWLFGVVWPVLYVGQSVASWLVWKNKDGNRRLPLGLYAAQLVLNFVWQPLFFKFKRVDAALGDAAAMTGLAAAAAVTMTRAAGARNSKIAVACLMAPYVGWLAFATALNAKILQDNPDFKDLEKLDDKSPATAPVTAATTAAAKTVAGK